MAKKNAFQEFGEFVASHLDGSIFDILDGDKTNDNGDSPINIGNTATGNASQPASKPTQPDTRGTTGSTFATAKPKEKGSTVNSGNSGKGGNDGNGIPAPKGNESKPDEKAKPDNDGE